jgi:hypothetical protein
VQACRLVQKGSVRLSRAPLVSCPAPLGKHKICVRLELDTCLTIQTSC